MVEAPKNEPGAEKRRTTRLVQSVPLTVSGVDALGQPFKERTSTLIINCHGCKYQSKHYVLKDSWVTLEVPHREQGQLPIIVRGQVSWIQKPRTLRELFTVGVELETPGNVWGIAFPPADWFPFPEEEAPRIPLPAGPEAPSPPPQAPLPSVAPPPKPEAVAPPTPAPGPPPVETEPESLAHLAERLLSEARQQLQQMAREMTATAAATEAERVMRELSAQMQGAAEQAVERATQGVAAQAARQVERKIEETRSAQMLALRTEWTAAFERDVSSVTRELNARIAEAIAPLRENLQKELAAQTTEAAARLETLRHEVRELEDTLANALARSRDQSVELQTQFEAATDASRAGASAHAEELRAIIERLRRETQNSLVLTLSQGQEHLTRLREEAATALAELQAGVQAASEAVRAGGQEQFRELGEATEELRRETHRAVNAIVTEAQRRLSELKSEADAAAEVARAAEDARIRELQAAAEKLQADVAQTIGEARLSWREKLESDMTVAGTEWNAMLDAAVARGTERLDARLEQSTQAAVHSAEARMQERAAEVAGPLEKTAGAIQESFAQLRAALAHDLESAGTAIHEVDRAIARVAEQATQLEQVAHQAVEQLEDHTEEVVAARVADLRRRAKILAEGTLARLQPEMDAVTKRFLERLAAEAEQTLAPQLLRASEAVAQLAGVRQEAEAAGTAFRERLRADADEQFRTTTAQAQEALGLAQKEFANTGRAMIAKWLEDLDEKNTDLQHTAFESLYKAAEWYQKKAQTQMQSVLERIVEDAAARLREKAGEVAGIFAGELDHRSRSFVEHTQGLLEESARELLERGRAQMEEVRETRVATFDDDAHRVAQRTLEQLSAAAEQAVRELSVQVETRLATARAAAQQQAESAVGEFERRVRERLDDSLLGARSQAEASLKQMLEAWTAERDAQHQAWRDQQADDTQASIEHYRERLELASNAWLAASAATLHARVEGTLKELSQVTQDRLRETFAQSLTGLADTMRARLLELSRELVPPAKPAEQS